MTDASRSLVAAPGHTPGADRPVPALSIVGLSKTFPGMRALDDVSFDVARGRVHALLGGNGSGKSTLIKVLAGVHRGDPGGTLSAGGSTVAADAVTPAWSRAAGIGFVHQDLGLFAPLTVAENLFCGQPYPRRRGRIDWPALRREAEAALGRLELPIDPDRVVATLRPAEATLVAIARALRLREEAHDGLLVLDEPTARLPRADVDDLLATVRRYAARGQAILYVSHRLDEVLDVADDVAVLRDGALVVSRSADGLDSAALARLIVGRRIERETARRSPRAPAAGRPVLALEGLAGGPLAGIDLTVGRGEIVALAGLVGSGRTSVLETAFGVRPRATGRVLVDGVPLPPGDIAAAIRAGLAYVPEDRAHGSAFLQLALPENLSAATLDHYRVRGTFRRRRERADAERAVATYAIRAPSLEVPLAQLSGGNQQKAILARWLRRAPKALLLDEPTQGIDVGARAEVYAQIERAVEQGAGALLVSSDIEELLRLADRVAVLRRGRLVATAARAEIDREWLIDRIYDAPEGGTGP